MKRSITYYLIFLLIVGPGLGQKSVAAATTANDAAVVSKKQKAPNTALKLVQGPLQAYTVHSFQKLGNPGISAASAWENNCDKDRSIPGSAYTLLLLKDYLFFIYPSHHFW